MHALDPAFCAQNSHTALLINTVLLCEDARAVHHAQKEIIAPGPAIPKPGGPGNSDPARLSLP
jgi:hypothetical protein